MSQITLDLAVTVVAPYGQSSLPDNYLMHQPTAPELEILKLLWLKQPLTARELHDELSPLLGWGYSSTRKTLERMGAKGFIACDSQGNKNSYTALLDKMPTLAAFAQDFANRVFEINGPLPVAMFANSKLVNANEIADLEKLLLDLAEQQLKLINDKDA